ncbi:MAG TPA: hypothetical protein VI322_04555 [Candidatus Saccharimonadia bacterium]
MSAVLTFRERFLAIVVPTSGQTIMALAAAFVILVAGQSRAILERIGVSSGVLHTISDQFHSHFDGLLRSEVASQLAVVTFWAAVGLVAYLVCWGAYNILVEARNEVTLTTVYTNRGHWRSPYHTLALKAVAAAGLALGVWSLWFGVALWMALLAALVYTPGVVTALLALVGWVGCAAQIYMILALIQLTFTPWYRPEAFTDS